MDGALAVIFGADALWAIVGTLVGNLLGGIVMALHSAQGPRLGLPQMISSRAQFGVIGAVVPLVLVVLMYLVIGLLEASGAGHGLVQALLIALLVARILHPIGMFAAPNSPRQFACRGGGIIVTMAALGVAAIALLLRVA